jgi:hypothetical protein
MRPVTPAGRPRRGRSTFVVVTMRVLRLVLREPFRRRPISPFPASGHSSAGPLRSACHRLAVRLGPR